MGSGNSKNQDKTTLEKIKYITGWALIATIVFFPILFPFLPLVALFYGFLYLIHYLFG